MVMSAACLVAMLCLTERSLLLQFRVISVDRHRAV